MKRGAPGSMAGGIKTVTFAVLILTLLSYIEENKAVTVFKREITSDTIKRALTVFLLAILLISITTIVLLTLNPQIEFIDMLFEVVSALATCGYSLGVTNVLTPASKIIIIIIMYIGRFSTVTMTTFLTGKKFKKSSLVQYPKANINVG